MINEQTTPKTALDVLEDRANEYTRIMNVMTEEEMAELATITAEELDNARKEF